MFDAVIRPGVISTVTGMRKGWSAVVGVTCPQDHFDITHLIAVSTQGSSILAVFKRWRTKRLKIAKERGLRLYGIFNHRTSASSTILRRGLSSSILKINKPT